MLGRLSPKRGPLSGGTRLTLLGVHLDYGSNFEVIVYSGTHISTAQIIGYVVQVVCWLLLAL